MGKAIEDYLSKLKELAEQARTDGRNNIFSFIEKLISTNTVEIEVYEFILRYFDNLIDKDMEIYTFLLEKGANSSWYEFVEFLGEERGSIVEYFPVLNNCYENHITVEELRDMEKNSKNFIEFKELADAKIGQSNESNAVSESKGIEHDYIEHLKAENSQLNKRLNIVMDELNKARSELKEAMESSINNKKSFMDNKIDVERLKKENEKLQSSLKIFEKKIERNQLLISQLSAINDSTIAQKEELEETISKMRTELETFRTNYMKEKAENGILEKQIESLEQQIANLRIHNHKDRIENEDIKEPKKEVNEEYLEDIYMEDGNIIFDFDEQEEMQPDDADVTDYNPDDLIPISDNKNKVKKHSNLLFRFLGRCFEKRFEKQSQAEQDNLIFIKLMENEYSKEVVQLVKKALISNNSLSRLEIYKMISNKANSDDIMILCNQAS